MDFLSLTDLDLFTLPPLDATKLPHHYKKALRPKSSQRPKRQLPKPLPRRPTTKPKALDATKTKETIKAKANAMALYAKKLANAREMLRKKLGNAEPLEEVRGHQHSETGHQDSEVGRQHSEVVHHNLDVAVAEVIDLTRLPMVPRRRVRFHWTVTYADRFLRYQ